MAIELLGSCPLLQVFDMPTSIDFYCHTLGFEIVNQSEAGPLFDWVLLRSRGVELMLNTAYERDHRPAQPDRARMESHADMTIYFGCFALDQAYATLREKGLQIREPTVAPYGMRQMYLLDPDGYNLCFQYPATKETLDQWKNWYGLDPNAV